MISTHSKTIQSLRAGARWWFVALLFLALVPLSAGADARDQAMRIHDRLLGVPPDATTLTAMTDLIAQQGDAGAVAAAELAPRRRYQI